MSHTVVPVRGEVSSERPTLTSKLIPGFELASPTRESTAVPSTVYKCSASFRFSASLQLCYYVKVQLMQTIQYLKVLVQFEASEAIPVLFQNEAKVNFHFLLLLHESCLAPETRSCFEYLFFHLTFSAFDFFWFG